MPLAAKKGSNPALWAAVLLLCLGFPPMLGAKEKAPDVLDEYNVSAQEMYRRWSRHSPAEVVAHAKKAQAYLIRNGVNEKSLESFNDPTSQWWPDRPFFSLIIVMRCDEFRDVSHPIDGLREALTKPGVAKKFRDARGELVFFDLCVKIRYSAKGAWAKQYNYWPGSKDLVWMGILGMPIPGTPYQLQLFYVHPDPDPEALDKLLE